LIAAKEKLEIVIGVAKPRIRIFAGAFLAAACGGENRPNYFQNRPPFDSLRLGMSKSNARLRQTRGEGL